VAVSADTISNSSATASQLAFSTAPAATVSAGGNAGSAITVLEEDNNGNSVNATDIISLAVSGANGYFKSYTATASDGVATFNLSNYALTVSGSYTYTATVASNTSIKSAAASETVYKATPVITWATPVAITYGTALDATQPRCQLDGRWTFVYSPATGTVLTAGSQTLSVTFTPTDATDYNSAGSTVQLTVNQATPGISFTVPNHTYGDAPITVSATSNSSGAITYSVVSGPATISGSTVTLTGRGHGGAAGEPGCCGQLYLGTQTATFTVAGNAPTISFTVPNHTYGDAPITVSATSNSSGAITYSVVSGPATISGSTVTLTGAGTWCCRLARLLRATIPWAPRRYLHRGGQRPDDQLHRSQPQPTAMPPITVSATSNSFGGDHLLGGKRASDHLRLDGDR